MSKFGALFIFLMLFCISPSFSYSEQKQEMKSFYNAQYGIKFLYPQSWELQMIPDPLKTCEYEIRLRPLSWLKHLASSEWRRYSDFPLQILLCKKDYITLAESQLYIKKEGQWVTQGTEMDTSDIKGKGWHGFVGEAPFRPLPKDGDPGPELYLQQAVIGIAKNRSLLVVMEYTKEDWSIDNLLQTLEIIDTAKGGFYRTSYNCNKSKSDIEKTICMNKELADADLEMDTIYKALMNRIPKEKREILRKEQKGWLEERNAKCQSDELFNCLKEKYSKRITVLKTWR